MLKEFHDFERDPALLAEFEEVAKCYSASCVFADVQYRTGVMHSAIRAAFPAKAVGQALTVQLSKGDLVDPLKALEMGRPGDLIVVDAGGDTETSVCGGLMGGLAKNRGIRGMIVDGAGRDIDELRGYRLADLDPRDHAPRHPHHVLGPQGGALDQRPDHLWGRGRAAGRLRRRGHDRSHGRAARQGG